MAELFKMLAEQIPAEDQKLILSVLTIYCAIFFCIVAFVFGAYLVNAIALYRLAKRTGVKHGWLGFIPLADFWLLGRLSDVGSTRRHSGARLLAVGGAYYGLFAVWYTVFWVMYDRLLTMIIQTNGTVEPPVASIFSFILPIFILIPLLFALAIATQIFMYISYYRIAENFESGSPTAYLVGIILCSVFCSYVTPVLLLILSTNTPKAQVASPTLQQ